MKKKILARVGIAAAAIAVILAAVTAVNIRRYQHKETEITYINSDEIRVVEDTNNQGIGTVEVSTLKIPAEMAVRRCCYTPEGSICFSVKTAEGIAIYIMKDDGSGLHPIYQGPLDGSYRFMFDDTNTKILLGNEMLEVPEGKTVDTCGENEAVLIPIEYPAEYAEGGNVVDKWTEVVLSNDGEYIVWTARRSDVGAANLIGRLVRYDDKYVIEDAQYCSRMNAYTTDPATGEITYTPIIGGEVKQFVRGGTALTLVGSAPNGNGNSVLQDLATGEVTELTHAPGYDETTLLSPSEKYGIVMTSRFSETSDLAVLGLMDRPFGDVIHSIMDKIYMYSVTGIRSFRQGNIGPAIINVERSISERDYMGVNVSSDDPDWIYYSPMSWNPDSTRATWIEKERETGSVRVQVATLTEALPEYRPATVATPAVGDYADKEITGQNDTYTLSGRNSGTVTITKKKSFFNLLSEVTVVYDNYSDDGEIFYNGTEYAKGSMMTKTNYTSDVKAVDKDGHEIGMMDVDMTFTAAYGLHTITKHIASPMLLVEKSRGTARWMDTEADISSLIP